MTSRSDAENHTADQIFNSFIEGERAFDGRPENNPVKAVISKFVEMKSSAGDRNIYNENTEANVALYLVCKYAGTKKGHVETLVRSYGADPNYVLDESIGDSPLQLVASRCESLGTVNALLELGADVNFVNKSGRTPLIAACDSSSTSAKRLEIIRHLLKWRGIEIEKTDKANRTACFYAASVSNFWIMRELFLAGASVMPKIPQSLLYSNSSAAPLSARGVTPILSPRRDERHGEYQLGQLQQYDDELFPFISPLQLTAAMAQRRASHTTICLPGTMFPISGPSNYSTARQQHAASAGGGSGSGSGGAQYPVAVAVNSPRARDTSRDIVTASGDTKIVCGIDVSGFKLDSAMGRYGSYFDILSSSLIMSKEVMCYNMSVRRCCEELRERRNEAMRLQRLQGAGTTLSPSIPVKRLSMLSPPGILHPGSSAPSSPLHPNGIDLSLPLPPSSASRPSSARPNTASSSRVRQRLNNQPSSLVLSPRQVALSLQQQQQRVQQLSLFQNNSNPIHMGGELPLQGKEGGKYEELEEVVIAAAGGGREIRKDSGSYAAGGGGSGSYAGGGGSYGGGGGGSGAFTVVSVSPRAMKEGGAPTIAPGGGSNAAVTGGAVVFVEVEEETLRQRRLARKAERAKKRKERQQDEKKREWKDMRITMAQKVDSKYTQKIRLRDGEEENELYEAVLEVHRKQEQDDEKHYRKDADEKEQRRLERKQRKKAEKRSGNVSRDSPSKGASAAAWESARPVLRPSSMNVDELFKNLDDEVVQGVNELAVARGSNGSAAGASTAGEDGTANLRSQAMAARSSSPASAAGGGGRAAASASAAAAAATSGGRGGGRGVAPIAEEQGEEDDGSDGDVYYDHSDDAHDNGKGDAAAAAQSMPPGTQSGRRREDHQRDNDCVGITGKGAATATASSSSVSVKSSLPLPLPADPCPRPLSSSSGALSGNSFHRPLSSSSTSTAAARNGGGGGGFGSSSSSQPGENINGDGSSRSSGDGGISVSGSRRGVDLDILTTSISHHPAVTTTEPSSSMLRSLGSSLSMSLSSPQRASSAIFGSRSSSVAVASSEQDSSQGGVILSRTLPLPLSLPLPATTVSSDTTATKGAVAASDLPPLGRGGAISGTITTTGAQSRSRRTDIGSSSSKGDTKHKRSSLKKRVEVPESLSDSSGGSESEESSSSSDGGISDLAGRNSGGAAGTSLPGSRTHSGRSSVHSRERRPPPQQQGNTIQRNNGSGNSNGIIRRRDLTDSNTGVRSTRDRSGNMGFKRGGGGGGSVENGEGNAAADDYPTEYC